MLDSKLRDRHNFALWKDGRVAEGSGLENRRWETRVRISILPPEFAGLAQLVEQLTCNQ